MHAHACVCVYVCHGDPTQVSKGPQENVGKFGGHSNFTVCIQYVRCKIELTGRLSPAAQKAKV